MNYFSFAFVLVFAVNARAQSGCTDAQASNFNAAATVNDGSCIYPATSYTPVFKANLPGELKEISGLTLGNAKWWGHADSGFNEEFFSLDPETGNVDQTVELKNAKNRDWEDIASDSVNLYVGDFGNNSNDRQNLGIYIVPHSEIGNSNSETVQEFEWSYLPFSYVDQTNYATMSEDSSVFDCEAMIAHRQKLHLFTKSRRNYNTVHYVVNPSSNVADKIETFDTQGLITGASVAPDGKLIALVGYDLRPFIPTVFCWLLWDWKAGTNEFFSGNKRRIELGTALQVGQVESIGFDTDRTAYISNERTAFNGVTLVGESVRKLDFSAWVPASVGAEEPDWENAAFAMFPNPFSQTVHFQFQAHQEPDVLRITNQLGQTVLTLNEVPKTLNLSFLTPGYYTFEIWKNGQQIGRSKGLKQ